MASKLEVIVGGTHDGFGTITGGTTYDLSDNVEYIHIGNDGLGLPEFERFMESGPLQDGATDRGYLLRPRKIQLVINLIVDSRTLPPESIEGEYWSRRSEILDIFKPRNTPIFLKFTPVLGRSLILPSGATVVIAYCLECYTAGGLTLPSTDKQGLIGHKITVQLICPDPTWFLPTVATETILSGTSTSLSSIYYLGNANTYPKIRIVGPLNSPIIRSYDETGLEHKLDFTGYNVPAGTTITIDTRYGVKTVMNTTTGTSIIDKLLPSSALATFAIFSRYTVGTASVSATGSGRSSATRVYFDFSYRSIGI